MRVDPTDLRAFMQRDRARLRAYKHRAWEANKAEFGATPALLASESLRKIARALNPDWPTEADRRADLEMHQRVGRALRMASRR